MKLRHHWALSRALVCPHIQILWFNLIIFSELSFRFLVCLSIVFCLVDAWGFLGFFIIQFHSKFPNLRREIYRRQLNALGKVDPETLLLLWKMKNNLFSFDPFNSSSQLSCEWFAVVPFAISLSLQLSSVPVHSRQVHNSSEKCKWNVGFVYGSETPRAAVDGEEKRRNAINYH